MFVALIVSGTQRSHAALGANIDNGSLPGAYDLGVVVGRTGEAGTAVLSIIDSEVSRQAAMLSYLGAFHLLAWILILLTPVPLLLRPPRKTPEPEGIPSPAH